MRMLSVSSGGAVGIVGICPQAMQRPPCERIVNCASELPPLWHGRSRGCCFAGCVAKKQLLERTPQETSCSTR